MTTKLLSELQHGDEMSIDEDLEPFREVDVVAVLGDQFTVMFTDGGGVVLRGDRTVQIGP